MHARNSARRALFQFAKSAVKLAVVSVILTLYLLARGERILASLYADPGQVLALLGRLTFEFLMAVTVLAVVMGAVDWMWEWLQHQQKNRMTRQEMMDEAKSSGG